MPRFESATQRQLAVAGIYRDYRSTQVPGYQNLSLNVVTTGGSTLYIQNNGTNSYINIGKTAGTTNWETAATSTNSFTPPFSIEFQNTVAPPSNLGNNYCMIGIVTPANLANIFYTGLDWAWFPITTDASQVFYSQGTPYTASQNWNNSLTNYLVYDTTGNITFYNGGTLLRTVTNYSNFQGSNPVYIRFCGYTVNPSFTSNLLGGITNLRVYNRAWNGSTYV
jgi:hypothetical protein